MDASTPLALPPKHNHVDVGDTRFATALSSIISSTPGVSIVEAPPVLPRASLLMRRNSKSTHIHDEIIASRLAAKDELATITVELNALIRSKKCLCNTNSLSPQDVQSLRHSTRYYIQGPDSGKSKTPADHNLWLISCIMQSRKRKIGTGNEPISISHASRHAVLGLIVCTKCFITLFGISKSKYDRCVTELKAQINSHGSCTVLSEQLGTLEKSVKFETLGATFLRKSCDMFASECEAMPHQLVDGDVESSTFSLDETSRMEHNETRYYPSCYSFMSMHSEYVIAANDKFRGSPPPFKYDHFYKTLNRLYPNCRPLPRTSVLFKCPKCSNLRAEFDGCNDERVRLLCLHYMKRHKHAFRQSRQYYADTIARCISNYPHEMSHIVDGMDQNKCCTPRIANSRMEIPRGCQVKFHVIGSLVHGVKLFAFCLVSSKWAQAGPQMTVTVILKTLRRCVDLNGYLPPIYNLQLDNPTGENKNHDVFSFLGVVVEWDVFCIVNLTFGIPGHTHFDIDQCFSRLSVALGKGHLTIDEFFECIRNGFTHHDSPTEATHCGELANWHLASAPYTHEFSGITKPYLFRFSKDSCGHVVVHYKSHCDKPTWKGGARVFKKHIPLDTLQVCDWPFVPIDGAVVQANMQNLAPSVPSSRRSLFLSSWAAFIAAEVGANAHTCATCTSLRMSSKCADTAVYQMEKGLRKSYKSLSTLHVPIDLYGKLSEARSHKRTKRALCDKHVSKCLHTNNDDFAWLQRFAKAPIVQRQPDCGLSAPKAPAPQSGSECPDSDQTSIIDEKLARLKDMHEAESSSDDDESRFCHKSAQPSKQRCAPTGVVSCNITPGGHMAVLVEAVPGDRSTAEWAAVKVVAAASTEDVGSFTASVLDFSERPQGKR